MLMLSIGEKKSPITSRLVSHFSTYLLTAIGLSLALLISGCSKDDEHKAAKQQEASHEIVLSVDGVGPLNATTSFNMHQMTMAFNGLSVEEMINFQTGVPYPVIRVSKQGKTVLTVNPDDSRQNIYSVIIEDNSIKNNLGHQLGSHYSDIYAYGQTTKCQPGSHEMAGKVLCYAPAATNILYVFQGQWGGPDGKLPPAEIMQNWVLDSIVWRPKI